MNRFGRILAVAGMTALVAVGLTGCNSDKTAKEADKAAVEVANQYLTLGNYKGVEITKLSEELTQEDIDEGIKLLQSKRAYYADADRPVEMYDIVNIDLSATLDGEALDGFTVEGYDVYVGLGAYVMDGFGENLVGMSEGVNTFTMTIPDTFSETGIIGEDVEFTVVINSIKGITYPEFNDAFVQTVTEYKTVDEYMPVLEAELAKEKKEKVISAYKLEAWEKVVKATECTGYPEELFSEKKASIEAQFKLYADLKGITVDAYINETYGMSLDEYVKGNVKQIMMFELIADTENITISEKEYVSGLEKFAKQNGYEDSEEFETKFGKEVITEAMLWDKVQQFIVDNATFTE